jgi:peptidoglycan-associated lipoprotein
MVAISGALMISGARCGKRPALFRTAPVDSMPEPFRRSPRVMKPIQILAVAVLALGLAACQKPKQVKPDETAATTTTDAASTSGIGDAGTAGGTTAKPLTPQQQALADLAQKSIVYFDFDSSEIRPEYVSVIAAHAGYLVKFPSARVRLEGHTDERGSREYNIGLGERRAQAVRSALMLQGVADAQITTVSYGEERPAVEGSDDAAHAQNRRVELVHAQ